MKTTLTIKIPIKIKIHWHTWRDSDPEWVAEWKFQEEYIWESGKTVALAKSKLKERIKRLIK